MLTQTALVHIMLAAHRTRMVCSSSFCYVRIFNGIDRKKIGQNYDIEAQIQWPTVGKNFCYTERNLFASF